MISLPKCVVTLMSNDTTLIGGKKKMYIEHGLECSYVKTSPLVVCLFTWRVSPMFMRLLMSRVVYQTDNVSWRHISP